MVTVPGLLAALDMLSDGAETEQQDARYRHVAWLIRRIEAHGYGRELEHAIEAREDVSEERRPRVMMAL